MYCRDVIATMGRGRLSGAKVYFAISDPTRRRMLDLLRGPQLSVTQLAKPFRMSQPAVSQHLRVLREAGLVTATRAGRERHYRLRAGRLREVYDWLGHYEKFWNEKLGALGELLDEEESERRGRKA